MQWEQRDALQWHPYVEWTVENQSHQGNPFDLVASVEFTHSESGDRIQTEMFYDGADRWKFRFTGTRKGRWAFRTTSRDVDLDGISGAVFVKPNGSLQVHGFVWHSGSKWVWRANGEAFVPQYVMGPRLRHFYDRTTQSVDCAKVESAVQEFIDEHGFTGFHLCLAEQWLDVEGGDSNKSNPDPRTFVVLETLIRQVYLRGGTCHLWMWGSDHSGTGPKSILGAAMNAADRRLLRYVAARLGPLPGWTMGYGYDTENLRWATPQQMTQWKGFLDQHLGWKHLLGARVGFDENGPKGGPKPPLDAKFNAPVGDDYCSWLGGDYFGYTSYRPMYERYVEVLEHRPNLPSLEEDRFRLRHSAKWKHKDYTPEMTRRGLWHSTMAGGVGNIWGNLLPTDHLGGSQSYDAGGVHLKQQIRTYATFFGRKHRFLVGFKRDERVNEAKIARTDQGAAESLLQACLRDANSTHLIVYQEGTSSVQLDLRSLPRELFAVAVDTCAAYRELEIGLLGPGETTWNAPYSSDWAIAIGDFEGSLPRRNGRSDPR